MKLSTEGLIIKEQHLGESDRLVTLLTKEQGLVRAFATGARNMKGKKQAATQLLAYGSYIITQKKDIYRISEADCLDVFFGLRQDLVKLSLAQYFCELSGVVVPEQDDASLYLRIMLNALKFLEKDKLPAGQIKGLLEFSLLTLAGYMPDVSGCCACGQMVQPMYFDPVGGALCCEEHRLPGSVPVGDGVIRAIAHVTTSPLAKLFSFSLSPEAVQQFASVGERFVQAQLERTFTTLEFYHGLS